MGASFLLPTGLLYLQYAPRAPAVQPGCASFAETSFAPGSVLAEQGAHCHGGEHHRQVHQRKMEQPHRDEPVPAGGLVAALAGAVFLAEVHRLHRASRRDEAGSGDRLVTMRLFHLSLVYLTLLFAAVAAGALVH